jgi:hypothetical protein
VTRVVADTGDGADAVDGGGAFAIETEGALPATVLTTIPLVANLGTGDDQACRA